MTKENEDTKLKTPLSQSAVEGLVRPDGCPGKKAKLLESKGWAFLKENLTWFHPEYFKKGTSIGWEGALAWAERV